MRDTIRTLADDPAGLERRFRRARRDGDDALFASAIGELAAEAPENLLIQAWVARLAPEGRGETAVEDASETRRRWSFALGVSATCGLAFMLLARGSVPVPVPGVGSAAFWIGWSPLAALAIIAFLGVGARQPERRRWQVGAALAAAGVGTLAAAIGWGRTDDGAFLMALHLPFLAWAAVAGAVTAGRTDRATHLYAHAVQSLETLVAAGIFLGSGGIFAGLTLGLLEVFEIRIPDATLQVAAAFGIGIIPVLAVAATHDPSRAPARQRDSGIARLLRIMTWMALPAAGLVLLVYVFWLIPTNFGRAFEEREILMIYNATIIALIAAITAAASVARRDGAGHAAPLLRPVVLAVIGLTALLNLYALAANASRIFEFGLTANRHAVAGWNVVTLAMLGALLVRCWSHGEGAWLLRFRSELGRVMVLPVAWAAWVVVVIPLL